MERSFALEPLSVSVTVLSQMFLYLASLNIDVELFLKSIGVNPLEIKIIDSRIPVDKYLLIQDEAALYTQDPYFGLHMGEFAEPGSWSILGYMLMNCRTLCEAIEKSSRYSRVIGNLIEASGYFSGENFKVIFSTPQHAPQMTRHCFEASISGSIRMMRNLSAKELSLIQVSFIYPEPESVSEYERIFKCPVLFNQPQNTLIMDNSSANTPVPMANPGLLDYFEKFARDFLIELDQRSQYTKDVSKIIISNLDDESLSIQKVAKEMSVSVRTLQNHLVAEGVLFSDLLKEIREKLAKKYLKEDYSVEQITYLLGFSEPSVFRKAFKKWCGVTPREYREHNSILLNQFNS